MDVRVEGGAWEMVGRPRVSVCSAGCGITRAEPEASVFNEAGPRPHAAGRHGRRTRTRRRASCWSTSAAKGCHKGTA